MKKVLVTGGAGFIGSNLICQLLDKNYQVICLDNFDDTYNPGFKEGNIAPFLNNKNFILYRVDIRNFDDLKKVFEKEKPSLVAHLAAKADTRTAVKIPHVYTSTNIEGTVNILECCHDYSVKNTVIASSSSVYGNNTRVPWNENENADRPLSPYGATKRAVEILAFTYHHNFNMDITCLRYFNAYGENNRPGMVPYIWTEKILKDEDIEISGDGSRKRDYTYVGDTAAATVLALEKSLGYEIINIGNNKPISLRELSAVFGKITGKSVSVLSRPSHHASVESTCADIQKAKELLNWEPTVSIDEGIKKLVSWFRDLRL